MVKGRDLNLKPGTICRVVTQELFKSVVAHEVRLIERMDMESGFYWLCKRMGNEVAFEIWPERMLSNNIVESVN